MKSPYRSVTVALIHSATSFEWFWCASLAQCAGCIIWNKTNVIPLRLGIKDLFSIQHHPGSPSQCNQESKINKRHTPLERKNNLLFTDDEIIYIENPEDSIRKLHTNMWA